MSLHEQSQEEKGMLHNLWKLSSLTAKTGPFLRATCGDMAFVTNNGTGAATNLATTSKQFAMVANSIAVQGNGEVNAGQSANYDSSGLPAFPSAKAGTGLVNLVK